jgi:hypothetical protein
MGKRRTKAELRASCERESRVTLDKSLDVLEETHKWWRKKTVVKFT